MYNINTDMKRSTEDILKELNAHVKNRKAAIRAKCWECSNFQTNEISDCAIPDCPLYRFRMGKDPLNVRIMSEKQKEALKKMRRLNPRTNKHA